MKEIVKICSKHGELTIEQIRRDGNNFRCKACRIISNNYSYYRNQRKRIDYSCKWKKENREKVNEWNKNDRKENPEKHKKWSADNRKKLGSFRNVMEISRIRGITTDQYQQMLLEQDYKCAICKNSETRKSRNGGIAQLCLDHNHITGKARHFLCHNCNTMIGKFFESIEIMESAINYLNKHGELCQK